MKVLRNKSDKLFGRSLPDSVCVECHCGEHLLWPLRGGNKVRCPTCGEVEELNIDGTMKLPPDKTRDNPEDLPMPPAKPFPPIPEKK